MSGTGGFWNWDARLIHRGPILDGLDWELAGPPENIGWEEMDDEPPTFALPTASGEHVIHSGIYDESASDAPSRFRVVLPLLANDEEQYFRLKRARRRGAPVWFIPFVYDEDVFSNVVAAEVRKLTRPVAWGIDASITSLLYPAKVFLNDVEDAGAATLSGTPTQTVTFNDPGTVAVRYLCAFRVLIGAVSERVPVGNGLACEVTLEEVISRA